MKVFDVLAGWKRHHVAGGIVLLPPAGMSAAAIQIRERVRPLRTLKALLDDALANLEPRWRTHATYGVAERFVNHGGDYVAFGSFASRDGAEQYEHVVAMIIADDWFAAIEGMVGDATYAPTVRDAVRLLAMNYYTGLGELSQRPYLYTPPPGWRGVPQARSTCYYGPGHPARPAVLYMFHARPTKLTAADAQDRLLFVETAVIQSADPPRPAKTFTTKHGLFGEMVKQTGRDAAGRLIESYRAMLVDKRFIYLSRLDAAYDEENRALADYTTVLEGVVPVPRPQTNRSDAVIHWSD